MKAQVHIHKKTMYLNDRFFTAKGNRFEIIGTRIKDDGQTYCSVVNRTTGAESELEHQTLCKLIYSHEQTK
jgi:hypothetical protein